MQKFGRNTEGWQNGKVPVGAMGRAGGGRRFQGFLYSQNVFDTPLVKNSFVRIFCVDRFRAVCYYMGVCSTARRGSGKPGKVPVAISGE